MIPLSLAAIAEITGARPHLVADPAATVETVVIDSRAAGPGALFAALPGQRVDGLDFAPGAVAAG
ncbi:MAG TPA: Mur ligase domain-containing protein, partial [Streptosporangiaceae bacterium]|nr:Mur ligase domain-containing protein [Streptosporangiaceae bacterium]